MPFCLLLLHLDGAVMPSWFDVHELPVTAVSYASLLLFFGLYGELHAYTVGLEPTSYNPTFHHTLTREGGVI